MNNNQKLRILLLDDNNDVLHTLKSIIANDDVRADELITEIEAVTVHIQLDNIANIDYIIKPETILEIARYCYNKFDYIISDFAFIGDKSANDNLRQKLIQENRTVLNSDFKNKNILRLRDIETQFNTMQDHTLLTRVLKKNFNNNFLGHRQPIIIYTNSPDPFAEYFRGTDLEIRIEEIKEVFTQSKDIKFILMHDELDIPTAISYPTERNKDLNETLSHFITTLLSKELRAKIHKLALNGMVENRRYFKYENAKKAYNIIVMYGVGLGFAVALIGEVIFHFAIGAYEDYGTSPYKALLEIIASVILLLSTLLFAKLGVHNAKLIERLSHELTGYRDEE